MLVPPLSNWETSDSWQRKHHRCHWKAVIQHNVNADTNITKTAGVEKIAATLTSSLARPFTKTIDSAAIGAS